MTLDTVVKKWLIARYGAAYSTVAPGDIHVSAMCFMQFVKGALPPNIITVDDLTTYLLRKMFAEFSRKNGCMVVIVCFDIDTVPVKSIVEYGKRKEYRCKLCKKTNGFSPDCGRKGKKCKDLQPLRYEDGPHLPVSSNERLPVAGNEWMRFAGDSRNLRHELYPRLMNALLSDPRFVPGLNQTLIVSGLPCQSEVVSEDHIKWQFGYTPTTEAERRILKPWGIDSLPDNIIGGDPDKFKRVYRFQNVNGVMYRHEVPEMKHSIPEADSAIFYFTKFYPNANFQYIINDGDALSIGLLRVIEDFTNGKCAKKRYVALPRRRELNPGEHAWTHEYFDMVQLKCAIEEDPVYTAAGVSNPIATVVFLIILSGTDFFKGYCPHIGYKTEFSEDPDKREKQTDGIWDTFHARLPLFKHLVQWNIYDMIPDPNIQRRIVLDEELFVIFTQYCYIHRYGKKMANPDVETVRAHCSNFKQKERQMPPDSTIRLWGRGADWNLNYWANSFRNIEIDPFKQVNGQSYYGYDKETMSITASVAPKQLEVDEVYARNFHKAATARIREKTAAIPVARKLKAIDVVRGKI
jgi:hypothetical protein